MHTNSSRVTLIYVEQKVSPIVYESSRPLGIGRITSFNESTSTRPGFLLGTSKGLYYLPDHKSKARRIRRHPVGWVLSGDNGVVCYEEISGRGRLAILYEDLTERQVDEQLARVINPKAYWKDGLIILHRNELVYLDLANETKSSMGEIDPTRNVGPFARVDNGFEFIAVHKGQNWPTYLYQMDLAASPGGKSGIRKIAQAEDPIFARVHIALPNGMHLVVPTGQALFQVYRIFTGDKPGLRTWSLAHIVADAHPVGGVIAGDRLWIGVSDAILCFKPAGEFLEPR